MSGQSYGNATIDWKAKAFDFTQVEVRLMALIMDEKSKAWYGTDFGCSLR